MVLRMNIIQSTTTTTTTLIHMHDCNMSCMVFVSICITTTFTVSARHYCLPPDSFVMFCFNVPPPRFIVDVMYELNVISN
jgi:hypothetical protein